jgi:RNA polymerase sigma-70 factor (ECF subfamily)
MVGKPKRTIGTTTGRSRSPQSGLLPLHATACIGNDNRSRGNKTAHDRVLSLMLQPWHECETCAAISISFCPLATLPTKCADAATCKVRRRAMKWRPLTELESEMTPPVSGNFEQVVMPHFSSAYNLARWLVGDAALAEDVVQDAVLRGLTYFGSYNGGDARSWLLRIVRNVAYGAIAARRRGGTTSLDDSGSTEDGESLAMQIADPGDDPEAALVRSQSFARLDQALAALPRELRECLVLHELEELSYKQVAHVTGVPIGTVMSRLWRARQALMRTPAEGVKR